MEMIDPFVFRLSIFVLAIFVGYFVVWSVTPALHTPLMSVTNAISSVIIVGALIAASVSTAHHAPKIAVTHDSRGNVEVSVDKEQISKFSARDLKDVAWAAVGVKVDDSSVIRAAWISKGLGFFALILASVNIFGGFLVTSRMLAMYRKKEKK